MGLFDTKKKKEKEVSEEKKVSAAKETEAEIKKEKKEGKKSSGGNERKYIKNQKLFNMLKKTRVTEKATELSSSGNAYVFEVDKDANKTEIAKAIKEFYNVAPRKICIVKIPPKKVFLRGKKGIKIGGKKAYVYLKQGDKIELI